MREQDSETTPQMKHAQLRSRVFEDWRRRWEEFNKSPFPIKHIPRPIVMSAELPIRPELAVRWYWETLAPQLPRADIHLYPNCIVLDNYLLRAYIAFTSRHLDKIQDGNFEEAIGEERRLVGLAPLRYG